jgi:16S rRNA processing protein RimM
MHIDDCYKIGLVLKPHGLKGEVTISIDDDVPNDFATLDAVFLRRNDGPLVPYFIQAASVRGDKAFVKFEDVDTPEAAQTISKHAIFLPKTARPKSARGEFYDDEIVNFEVTDTTAGVLGHVTDVMQAGANRLLVIMQGEKEVLIPVNSPFILSINKSKKTISVELPEGFLDI